MRCVTFALIVATMTSHSRNWLIGLLTWLFAASGVHAALADPLVVDPSSVGGVCSDTRLPIQVSVITPWCSLTEAVKTAPSGSVIYMRGGSYPAQDLDGLGTRSDYVTIEPYGYGTPSPEPVTISALRTANTSFLRFQGFHFVGTDASNVPLTPAVFVNTGSQNIQLIDDEVTGQGIWLDHSANHVLLQGNHIHDLTTNCAHHNPGDGAGMRLGGNDIQVLGNSIQGTPQDAIDMGASSNALVANNNISTQPQSQATCGYHVDLVQAENQANGPVTIENNTFDTGGQFILRNITGLTIQNNLMLRVDGWMQLMADPGARVINNTWWGGNTSCTGCGSLILRDWTSGSSWTKPPFNYRNQMTGAVVENNIMRAFGIDSVPRSQYREDYNLIIDTRQVHSPSIQGKHTLFGSPGLANPANNDFSLAVGSRAIDSGDSSVAPATDMFGHARWDDPFVRNSGAGPTSFVDRGAVELVPPPSPAPPMSTPAPFVVRVVPKFTRRAISRRIFVFRATCSARCRLTATARLSFVPLQGRAHRHHGVGPRAAKRRHSHPKAPGLRLRGKRLTLSAGKARRLRLTLLRTDSARLHRLARRYRGHAVVVLRVHARAFNGRVASRTIRVRVRL
jgi:parallel beta helix pectate lyase-like protein